MSVENQPNPNPKAVLSRIPLSQIRPSPRNTRRVIREEMVEARRASMANDGQANPITVRTLTEEEKATSGEVLYEIVDGEIRYRAALKNGDKEIDAYIKNLTPDEAYQESIKGNRGFKPGWFEDYVAMVELKKIVKNIRIEEIADLFEMDKSDVSHALQFIPRLKNKAILEIFDKSKNLQKPLKIDEAPIYRLNDLSDPEDIDKALPIVIDRQFTEPQVKDLVAHIQAGGDPAQFEPKAVVRKPRKGQKTASTPRSHIDGAPEGPNAQVGQPPEAEEAGVSAGLKIEPALAPQPAQPAPAGIAEPATKADKSKEDGSETFWDGFKQIFQGLSSAAIKDALGKVPKGSKWQSTGYILEKGGKALGHALGKLAVHLGRSIGKAIHTIAKAGANQFAPLGKSGSYKSHLSQTPLKGLGHGVVYLFITLFCYSALISSLGSFIPGVGPWVQAHLILLAHWLGSLLLGAAWNTLQKPLWYLGACLILLTWIHKTFKPGFGWILFMGALLLAAWWFRSEWQRYIPEAGSFQSAADGRPQTVSTQTLPPPDEVKPSAVNPPQSMIATPTSPGLAVSKPSTVDRRFALSKRSASNGLSTNTRHVVKPTVVAPAPIAQSEPLKAWTSAHEPLEVLLAELEIIPQPCVIKPYTPALDTEMSVNMATRRANDLTDSERYKAFIGHDHQTIVSATPNPEGLTLNFQGGIDLGAFSGGLLGGAAKNDLHIYWEDLKTIHCSEIQVASFDPKTLYQCSLVVSGFKKPFTVQCSSEEDCAHLVSALQFWVRTARKGANAPMAGLPYLNQGLGLQGDAIVKTLWDDSPAQKAGVQLGERVWSVETNKPKRDDRGEVERELEGFASGSHTLFVVTQADWEKANNSGLRTRQGYLRPLLYKLKIDVP